MKSLKDVPEMARSNAAMAMDQRAAYDDSIASHAQNVRDTLNDWGIEIGHGYHSHALAIYYEHVALLLRASVDAAKYSPFATRKGMVRPSKVRS